MSLAPVYQTNVHQIGQTVAWSLILNAAIISGALRYDKVAAIAHSVFGFTILIMTYTFVLYFLIPFGFNANTQGSWQLYAHGILGTMLLGFVLMQVVGGVTARTLQQNKKTQIFNILLIRRIHRYFGYFLAILYKVIITWAWFGAQLQVGIALLLWQILCLTCFLLIKLNTSRLEQKVTDVQTQQLILPQLNSLDVVRKNTEKYIMFGNYVYDARQLEEKHPGGYKVIELMKGRQVDRFLYGMYSAQLYPQLPAHSHSARSLQLVGLPIAKYVVPLTYQGLNCEVNDCKIKYLTCISQRTRIYSIGLVPITTSYRFTGYTDIRQLGQYYSFTLNNKDTRLYTSVNFLSSANIARMDDILKSQRSSQMKRLVQSAKGRQQQLPNYSSPNNIQERLIDHKADRLPQGQDYLPLMMKVYTGGKVTSALEKIKFIDANVKLSQPRGRGLELNRTAPGRIIVVAGGTGLFPFSDLIDLLFKAQLIEENHPMSHTLISADPILSQKPFEKLHFTFMIAINEPEDIHPITFGQLSRLSTNDKKFKIVLRVSKNYQVLQKFGKRIQFTREYFNRRVVVQSSVKGFSRVWICGPPKLNTDTAKILLESGFSNDHILLV